LHLAALALGPLVMLGLLFFIFRRGRKKQVVEAVEAAASEPNPLNLPSLVEAADPAAPVAPVVAGKPQRPGAVGQAIVEDPQKVYIRDQIQVLGKSNPGTVAQLIQTWLDEDRRN
jgi:flagellar biosynthesis/type III secretory pathway M-ring protein FliF/YscJ